ncbi:MAG: hypothetical protein ABSD74_05090 [Rhizomicrobium sp.]|jgi:hypothetical protein
MKVPFTAFAIMLVLGGAAAAQTGAPPPGAAATPGKFDQACGADIQQFCPTAQTKKDKHQCIKQNKAKLSQTCSAFLAEKKASRQEKKQDQQGAAPQTPGQPSSAQQPH